MIALSIKLSDELASTSQEIARKLGISRSELIRQSLEHELAKIQADLERREMAQSFKAMSGSAAYLRQAESLDTALGEMPDEEQDGWWKN
jgi:Ribbon-helix-helix protein, copG family.